MHVLIIPSEEFLPKQSHLAGIFQKHQALALQSGGCKVGILSIRQSLSLPMLIKAILFRLVGKRLENQLGDKSIGELVSLLLKKSFGTQSFITRENIEQLDVFRIDGFYFLPPSKHSNHFGWLKAGMQLWEHYCTINGAPDVIHAHNAVYAGILANKISKKKKIPYIITEHSSFVARNLESGLIKNKIKKSYRQAAVFFVVSDFLGKKIDELFKTKLSWKVMPNVLDPEVENAPMPVSIDTVSPFIFISIGSLIPLKRFNNLIDAFYQQFAGNINVKLKIAGNGELKEELQQQINKLQLQSRVELLGIVSRKEVLELIDSSHCLVLCSEFETFGVVLIETTSRGKPIVATRCGGPESIVNNENGLLYTAGDIDALSKAMLHIKENYEKYNQEEIRHFALTTYGSVLFREELKKKYEEVIS
jgi:glycosyltransferase involved in cell wall biosynthesis